MSAKIIGYINFIDNKQIDSLEQQIQQITPFGFKFSAVPTLYNYPSDLLQRTDLVKFIISDSKHSNTAEILLHEQDYDPDNSLEDDFQKIFPHKLEDRVLEVTKIINLLLSSDIIQQLGFSISWCDEIEQVKCCSMVLLEEILVKDCIRSCPPNILYRVDKN